jgi:hypothetical protein
VLQSSSSSSSSSSSKLLLLILELLFYVEEKPPRLGRGETGNLKEEGPPGTLRTRTVKALLLSCVQMQQISDSDGRLVVVSAPAVVVQLLVRGRSYGSTSTSHSHTHTHTHTHTHHGTHIVPVVTVIGIFFHIYRSESTPSLLWLCSTSNLVCSTEPKRKEALSTVFNYDPYY